MEDFFTRILGITFIVAVVITAFSCFRILLVVKNGLNEIMARLNRIEERLGDIEQTKGKE